MPDAEEIVHIGGDISGLDTALGKGESRLSKFGGTVGNIAKAGSGALGGFVGALGGGLVSALNPLSAVTTGVGLLTDVVKDGAAGNKEWGAAMAQAAAVVKSTGGAAGLTAAQLGDLATSLSGGAGVSLAADDAVLAGENLLATFTNIGKDTFPQATATMVDMAQAMGTDVSSQAVALGKALNDPIAGVGALSRVGVTFTAQQKEQIAAMMQAGDVAGAQAVIMGELNKEFGGSAAAAAQADGGMFQLSEQLDNLKGTIADAVMPVFQGFVGFLVSPAVSGALQGVASLIGDGLGAALDGLKGLLEIVGPPIQQFAGVLANAFGGGLKLDQIQALPGFLQPLALLFGTIAENVGEFFGALDSGAPFLETLGALIQNNLVDLLGLIGIQGAEAVGFIDGFKAALGTIAAFIQDPVLPALGTLAGWIGEQLPKVIEFEVGVWTNVLIPALKAVWGFIQDPLLPILGEIGAWLGENIPKALQTAADFWNNTLLPAMRASYQFSQENLVPILDTLGQWLGTNLPKALQTAADFWTDTLQPALSAVWGFIQDPLLPVLGTVASTLITVVGAAITGAADLWNNTLLPAITASWSFFSTYILPVLQGVADVISKVVNLALTAMAGIFQNVVLPALTGVWNFISGSLQPVFAALGGPGGPVEQTGGALSGIAAIWNSTLQPAVSAMAGFIGGALAGAFDGLKGAISGVTDFLGNLSNQLDNITLPDWMTPGSPTPWETGLQGVLGTLQQVSGSALPTLAGALGSLTQGATAQGEAGPMTPIVEGFQTFQALAGALAGQVPTLLADLPGAFAGVLAPVAELFHGQATQQQEGSIAYWWAGAKGLIPYLEGKVDQGSASLKAYMGPAWAGVFEYIGNEWAINIPALQSEWQSWLTGLVSATQVAADAIAQIMASIPVLPSGGMPAGGVGTAPGGGPTPGVGGGGGGGGGAGQVSANAAFAPVPRFDITLIARFPDGTQQQLETQVADVRYHVAAGTLGAAI